MAKPKMILAGLTDIGKKRSNNQDNLVVIEKKKSPLPGVDLIAVADGMGGHAGGEVASNLALVTLQEALKTIKKNNVKNNEINLSQAIKIAMTESNLAIRHKAKENPNLTGMGTTLTVALIKDNHLILGNVGDSRGYIINDTTIRQISTDHSLVAEQVAAGLITAEEAETHPQRNIITRAIGISENVDVDIFKIELKPRDIVFLCSDGLYPLVSNEEIYQQLQIKNLNEVCKKLIDLANERGGYDNITIAIAKVDNDTKYFTKKQRINAKTRSGKTIKSQRESIFKRSLIKKLSKLFNLRK